MSPTKPKGYTYQPVAEEEELSQPHYISPREKLLRSSVIRIICLLCGLSAAAFAGFFAGRLYASSKFEPSACLDDGPVHLDRITVKFESNRSFLQHPSYETEGLWKTLYPKDTHGLFEYPDENPERAGFAAFHQLHCVDALRRGYYQADDIKQAMIAGREAPEFENPVDEIHTLHCIEFLRQSIMCHADTTIQTEAEYHRGILAFGVEYQCRNWSQLVDWVDDRNARFSP